MCSGWPGSAGGRGGIYECRGALDARRRGVLQSDNTGWRLTSKVEVRLGAGGEIQGGGHDVRETQDGEQVVALAEVAGGHDGEDGDEGEGEGPDGGAREAGAEAAEKMEADSGRGELGEQDAEFEEGGGGEVQEVAEAGGQEQKAHDEGRVGLEDLGSVKCGGGEHAIGDVEAPELVVAGGGKESEQDGHGGGRHGERAKDLDRDSTFGGGGSTGSGRIPRGRCSLRA